MKWKLESFNKSPEPAAQKLSDEFYQAIATFTEALNLIYARQQSGDYSNRVEMDEDYDRGTSLLIQRGKSYFNVGKYKEAIDDFEKARFWGSFDIDCFYYTGLAYQKTNNFEEALKYFRYFPADKRHKIALCNLYYEQGQKFFKRAFKQPVQYISLEFDYDEAIVNFTKALNLLYDRQQSSDYSNYVEMDEDYDKVTSILIQRGISYFKIGKYKNAIEDFEKAIYRGSFNNNCSLYLGLAYQKTNNFDKALELLEPINKHFHDNEQYKNAIFNLYFEQGKKLLEEAQLPHSFDDLWKIRTLFIKALKNLSTGTMQNSEEINKCFSAINVLINSIEPYVITDELSLKEVNKIGSGQSADIYQGKYQNKEVALKKFTSESFRKEFENEKNIFKYIMEANSSGVYSIIFYGYSFTEKGSLLVTELMDGTLYEIVTKNKLNEVNQKKLIMNLAQGINFLHHINVVHRDIKPENILINETTLDAKFCDFGLAFILKPNGNNYRPIDGTEKYLAPELMINLENSKTGQTYHMYDKSVDIYSLSLTFWFIYSKIHPYSNFKNINNLRTEVSRNNYREDIPQICPNNVRYVIEKGWFSNPYGRLKAQEIVEKLEQTELSTDPSCSSSNLI